MKYFACVIVMTALCSIGFADPVPHMPELEAFIEKGEFVTTTDLKRRGGEVEQRELFKSYKERLGLSEEEVRAQFPDIVMYVGYLGGGKFDAELYETFKARCTLDSEDLYLRHNAILKAFDQDTSREDLLETMRLNILEMREQGYSPIRVSGASADYRKRAEDENDHIADDQFMMEQVAFMLSTIELDTKARVYLFDKFVDPYIDVKDEGLRGAVYNTFENTEGIDPWFLHMVRGVNQERIAWIKRGSGYAYTVSGEEFNAFHHHLDESIKHLKKAYEIDPLCPQAPAFLVQSVYPRGSLWQSEGWTWFGRTLIGCIDYGPVYDSMRHITQDKWHGDLTSRAEFAQWCARPDLAGYGVGLQALLSLERSWWTYGVDYGDADWFWEEEGDAIEAVMRSFERRIELGWDHDLNYEHSILAFLEYRYNGDLEKTAMHIRACENGINDYARRKMRFDDLNLVAITLPLSVEQTKPKALEAVAHEQAGNLDLAIDVWNEVYTELVEIDDIEAADALRDRLQGLRWRAAYDERSGWIDMPFDEQMSGWIPHEGDWERVDNSTVRGTMKGSENELLLVADLITGYWYEMEATVHHEGPLEPHLSYGINFCRGNRQSDGWDQMRFLSVRPNEQLGAFGWHYAGKDIKTELPPANADGTYRIRLKLQGDRVSGYINGQLVGEGEIPNWKPDREPEIIRVGLGAFRINEGYVDFSDIRIRKRRPPEKIEF